MGFLRTFAAAFTIVLSAMAANACDAGLDDAAIVETNDAEDTASVGFDNLAADPRKSGWSASRYHSDLI